MQADTVRELQDRVYAALRTEDAEALRGVLADAALPPEDATRVWGQILSGMLERYFPHERPFAAILSAHGVRCDAYNRLVSCLGGASLPLPQRTAAADRLIAHGARFTADPLQLVELFEAQHRWHPGETAPLLRWLLASPAADSLAPAAWGALLDHFIRRPPEHPEVVADLLLASRRLPYDYRPPPLHAEGRPDVQHMLDVAARWRALAPRRTPAEMRADETAMLRARARQAVDANDIETLHAALADPALPHDDALRRLLLARFRGYQFRSRLPMLALLLEAFPGDADGAWGALLYDLALRNHEWEQPLVAALLARGVGCGAQPLLFDLLIGPARTLPERTGRADRLIAHGARFPPHTSLSLLCHMTPSHEVVPLLRWLLASPVADALPPTAWADLLDHLIQHPLPTPDLCAAAANLLLAAPRLPYDYRPPPLHAEGRPDVQQMLDAVARWRAVRNARERALAVHQVLARRLRDTPEIAEAIGGARVAHGAPAAIARARAAIRARRPWP